LGGMEKSFARLGSSTIFTVRVRYPAYT